MGRDITSVRGVIFIDGLQTSPRQLTFLELKAIAREVKEVWGTNEHLGIWFDVETFERINNYWYPALIVSCYRLPGKTNRAVVPNNYLETLLNRKIRIFPQVQDIPDTNPELQPFDFTGHIIEVEFELE